MIDIPETHMCARPKGCICTASPTKLVSCKFIIPMREPGEQVTYDPEKQTRRREAAGRVYDRVQQAIDALMVAHAELGGHPLDSGCRRKQAMAFSELSQAQFELGEAFTYVPPKS